MKNYWIMRKQSHSTHTLETELIKDSCTINFPPLQHSFVTCVLPMHWDKFVVFFSSRVWMLFDANTQTKLKEGKTPFLITEAFSVGENKLIFFIKEDFQLYQLDLTNGEITAPFAAAWAQAVIDIKYPSLLKNNSRVDAFVKIMQLKDHSKVVLLWQKDWRRYKRVGLTDLLLFSCDWQGPTSITMLTQVAKALELSKICNITYSTIFESTRRACVIMKSRHGESKYAVLLIDIIHPQASPVSIYILQATGNSTLPTSLLPVADNSFILFRKNQKIGQRYTFKTGHKTLVTEEEKNLLLDFDPQTSFDAPFMPYHSEKHNLVVFDGSNADAQSLYVCNKTTGKLIKAYHYPRDLYNILVGFNQDEGESFVVIKNIIFRSQTWISKEEDSNHQSSISFDWFHPVLTRRQRKLVLLLLLKHAMMDLNGPSPFRFTDLFKCPQIAKDIYDCF